MEHVNLTLPLEAFDVSRFERAAGVGQDVPGYCNPILSQCLHPHALRMKSSIAVVPASVDAQNDLSAILQMDGEHSVLANLDRVDQLGYQGPARCYQRSHHLQQSGLVRCLPGAHHVKTPRSARYRGLQAAGPRSA